MMIFKKKSFPLLLSNFLWMSSFMVFTLFLFCLLTKNSILLTWEIMMISNFKIEMNIILDLYGSLFSSVVLFISASVMTFTINYMSEDKNIKSFSIIVLLFIMSMNFLIFIPSLIALLLGWDGLGIVSFVLVIYYQNPNSLAAGMVTALANRVGDVMLIISIAWMTVQGHWNSMMMFNTSFNSFLTLSILIAAMTKSAQIPFSSWLPAAMAAPTPVSALVHSSTLVTAGVFLLTRFYFFLEKTYWFNTLCLGVATLTCFMAGLCAMQEFDMKKIIALSTLSQLGVMMASLGLGAVCVSYFHMITHALFKALLFICAGNVIHQHNGSQDIRFMGNLSNHLPSTAACLNVANLALCGIPFMAGFYSKDLILEIFFMEKVSLIMVLIIIISTLFTLAYSIRFSLYILWGQHKKSSLFLSSDEDLNVNISEQMLSLGAIFGGALFSWMLFNFPYVVVLTFFQKTMILFWLMLTALVMLMINSFFFFKKSMFFSEKMNMIMFSLSNMWFLSILFSKNSSFLGMKWSIFLTKVSDQGWGELFGGQGMMLSSSLFLKKVAKSQNQLVSLFLFMSFFSFMVILIFV